MSSTTPSSRRKKPALTLADWRNSAGFSQHDLAAKAGVARATISHIESGRNNPSPGVARKIADAIGQAVSKELELHDIWPEIFKKIPA
jgi:transcriptional regulator with XRE-family HTH domain